MTKRTVLPVVVQRIQIAEGLARNLERLVLERRARQALSLADYLAAKALSADGERGVRPHSLGHGPRVCGSAPRLRFRAPGGPNHVARV